VSANKDDIMHLNTPDIGLQLFVRPHDVFRLNKQLPFY